MKKIAVITSVFFVIIFFAGCANKQTEQTKENSIKEPAQEVKKQETQLTVDGAIEKIKLANFSVGEKREAIYQMIGAYDGAKIDVGDTVVEIYQYKEAQKEAKEEAKKTMETADSIIFESSSLLIVVHSKDVEFANKLKLALE